MGDLIQISCSGAKMHPSQPITETTILRLKEGISLENANSGSSPAVTKFMHLTDIVKSQRGYKRQFWVLDHYLVLSVLKLIYI